MTSVCLLRQDILTWADRWGWTLLGEWPWAHRYRHAYLFSLECKFDSFAANKTIGCLVKCSNNAFNVLSYRIMEVWGLLLTPWAARCQEWTCELKRRAFVSHCSLISAFSYLCPLFTLHHFISTRLSHLSLPFILLFLRLLLCIRGPGGRGPWPGPNANSVSQKASSFIHDHMKIAK